MFALDIALAGTSTTKTYSLTSVDQGNSIRLDAAAALGEPNTLVIKHQVVKRTDYDADRHLVRLDHTFPGTSPDPDVVASVQLVIEAPRKVATAANVKDLVTRLIAFLNAAGYQDKLLNNEP
jgi:hypothetical protein